MGGGFRLPEIMSGGLWCGLGMVCERCLLCCCVALCCIAACAACEAVRLFMTVWSDKVAVGREGSKKPCECCLLCPFESGTGNRDGTSVGLDVWRWRCGCEELLIELVLELALELG